MNTMIVAMISVIVRYREGGIKVRYQMCTIKLPLITNQANCAIINAA